ncbi:hypothetical protein GCM10023333_06880 [Ferrimonas pelagia]|uniref:Uncharacterized protein n=1 Tax=Ferrimonas pelagia TaxID=1177826 RepID=A0ABP9EDN3_9GAMM
MAGVVAQIQSIFSLRIDFVAIDAKAHEVVAAVMSLGNVPTMKLSGHWLTCLVGGYSRWAYDIKDSHRMQKQKGAEPSIRPRSTLDTGKKESPVTEWQTP